MFNFIADKLNVKSLGEILAPSLSLEQQYHVAIEEDQLDKVKHLILQEKVNPNASTSTGNLPIHTACYFGSLNVLEYLINEYQSDINCMGPRDNTPLHFAASQGHYEIVKYLITKGADPTLKNKNRLTPYDVAKGDNIRQYLLPLQLQKEDPKDIQLPPGITPTVDPYAEKKAIAPPPTNFSTNYYATPGMPPIENNFNLNPSIPIAHHSQVLRNAAAHANSKIVHKDPSIYRPIQADGFGSSVGNEALTQKFGNVKEVKQTAGPPPLDMNLDNVNKNITYDIKPPSPKALASTLNNPYVRNNPYTSRYTTYDVSSNVGQPVVENNNYKENNNGNTSPARTNIPNFTIFNPGASINNNISQTNSNFISNSANNGNLTDDTASLISSTGATIVGIGSYTSVTSLLSSPTLSSHSSHAGLSSSIPINRLNNNNNNLTNGYLNNSLNERNSPVGSDIEPIDFSAHSNALQ